MIFTTKNKEFAIFGNTITDVKEKWKEFKKELAKNDGKLFGENGALASLFSGKKSNILTPETLKQFDEFKEKFNSSSLSAEALAEQMENVDQRIIDYAKTCKNGEMTTEGFKASIDTMSFSAKTGKVALQALAMAGNMIAMWAISKVISVATEKITELANASEIAKEKATSFANSVNNSVADISSNTSTLSELNEEYKRLSEGVNTLGENISLSTSEYDRYKEIVQQISDIMPNMTTYFNSQGDAIAFAKGELLDLNKEYEEYIQKQAKEFLVNGDEDGNRLQDALDNFSNNSEMGFWESLKNTMQNMFGSYGIDDLPVDTMISTLESLQNKSREDMIRYLNDVDLDANGNYLQTESNRAKAVAQKILDTTTGEIKSMTDEEFNTLQQSIASNIESLQNSNDVDMSAITSGLIQSAYSKDDFWAMGEDLRNDVTTLLSSIDADVWKSLGITEQSELETFVGKIVNDISSNKNGIADAWNDLFVLDVDSIPANEYISKANSFISTIANELGLDEEGKRQLRISLGFDTEITQAQINGLKEQFDDIGDNWVDTLTISELDIVSSKEFEQALNDQREKLNGVALSANDYAIALQNVKDAQLQIGSANTNSFDFSSYKDQVDDIQSSISALRDALEKLNLGTLDKESVLDLMQEFPDLIPYIDLAADGFGNLSEGLSVLIEQQPDSLIQSLQTLKESLNTDEERAQVDALINSLQALSSYGDSGMEAYAATIGSTWEDTANVIEGVTTQFENLAKVQEAVSNGLTMSATAAAELAKIYPEILDKAQFSADGQITLNEDVVKSILAGDQSIINAQIEKLEADKAELTAKKELALAELEIANQVGTAKGQITEDELRLKIETMNQELENEVEKDNQVSESYAQSVETMAENAENLDDYVGDVAVDMATNMINAAISMANSMKKNSENSQSSLSGLAKKASDVAVAIANAAKGIQTGNTDTIYVGKSGADSTGITKVKSVGNFSATTNDYINGKLSLDEFKSNLSFDISNYENAISNIDSQIEVLKNLQSTFEETINSANGGIGGHNYADNIKQLEAEKDRINNALDDAKSGASSTKNEFKELFDFFERRVKVLDNAISLLGSNLENVMGSFAKNQLIDAEVNLNAEKINNYTDALAMYTEKANQALASIPNDIAQKIQNGAVDLTTFIGDGNEEVVDAIKDYEQWTDKVADCKQELAELKEEIRQLELEKFNNIIEDFTNQFNIRDDASTLIDKQIALLQEAGQMIGESFYSAQIDQSKKQLELLETEKARLVEQMGSAIGSGRVNWCPLPQ